MHIYHSRDQLVGELLYLIPYNIRSMDRRRLAGCMLNFAFALLLLIIHSGSSAGQIDYEDQTMSPEEAVAVYEVLEAINGDIPWRTLHPGNPCLYGPHGLYCETDAKNVLHVVEFRFGWVSEDDNNPQCGSNASISAAFLKFQYLRKLFFYNCFTVERTVIPPVIWSLGASLKDLLFMRNPALVGTIPPQLTALLQLERLILIGNGLRGSIPAELGSLSGLTQLVLSRNQLKGPIPDSLGRLENLRVLDLSWNQLEGSLPATFGRLAKLEKLDLSHNIVSGNISVEVSNLRALQLLDVSQNNFSGCLPASFGNLGDLRDLQLSHNLFDCEIPDVWGSFSHLNGLGLSNAGFKGRIPQSMGELVNARYIDLSKNNLDGTIPIRLGHLPKIYQLDLSSNRLIGLVPFSSDFIVRMGRNLRVGRNEGLCYSSETGVVLDVRACDDVYSSDLLQEELSGILGNSAGLGKRKFDALLLAAVVMSWRLAALI